MTAGGLDVERWRNGWLRCAEMVGQMCGLAYEGALWAGFHDASKVVDESRKMALVRLALIHTEVSEASQNVKKGLGGDAIADELADALIRIGDLAATLGLDMEAAIMRCVDKNLARGYGYNGGLLAGRAVDPL